MKAISSGSNINFINLLIHFLNVYIILHGCMEKIKCQDSGWLSLIDRLSLIDSHYSWHSDLQLSAMKWIKNSYISVIPSKILFCCGHSGWFIDGWFADYWFMVNLLTYVITDRFINLLSIYWLTTNRFTNRFICIHLKRMYWSDEHGN